MDHIIFGMQKSLDYVSDYELQSTCKDAPCIAPSRVTQKIFAVLVDWVYRVVLTPSFQLVGFLHLYLLFYGREYKAQRHMQADL